MSRFVSVNTLDLHYKQAGTVTPLYSTVCAILLLSLTFIGVTYCTNNFLELLLVHICEGLHEEGILYSGVCYVHSLFFFFTFDLHL